MRAAAGVIACTALLLAAGCGGSKHASSTTSTQQAPTRSSGIDRVGVSSAEVRGGIAGVPAAALPGITVLGTGEQSAKPDRAVVGLTVGGSEIGPGGQSFALVEQSEIQPVVAALDDAGAEQIAVDRFAQGVYGNESAAQINFALKHPDEVDQSIAAARTALRKHTDYDLQAASVVFGFSDCASVEQEAWRAALADAADRAQQLADLSGAKLGRILAVSEAANSSSPYAPAASGCQTLRLPPAANVFFPAAAENTEQKVTVAVTLQVTYAVASQ